MPITKVIDEDGNVLHSCSEAGCETSWDGYVLATGAPVDGRTEVGEEWDTSSPGVARRKPPAD